MQVTIRLRLEEVQYQVALEAHLLGQSDLVRDKDARAVSLSQLDLEDESREVLLRSLALSVGRLREALWRYGEGEGTKELTNVPQLPDSATFVLRLPDNYYPPALEELEEGMHLFLVYSALSAWYDLMKDEQAGRYIQMAEGALRLVQTATSRRRRPERPCPPY